MEHGVSLVPPTGWERAATPQNSQLRLVHYGPMQANFRTNLNVTVVQDTGESYIEVSRQLKEQYPTVLADWTLIEEGPIVIGGKESYYVSATYRMGASTLRNGQYLVRGGSGKAYTLTFTTTSEAFEKLKDVFQRSAMSLRID